MSDSEVRFIDTTVLSRVEILKKQFRNPYGRIAYLNWHPDGSQFCIGTRHVDFVTIWDAATFTFLYLIKCHGYARAVWHPFKTIVALAERTKNKTVDILHLRPLTDSCDKVEESDEWNKLEIVFRRKLTTPGVVSFAGWDPTGSTLTIVCGGQLQLFSPFKQRVIFGDT